MHSCCDYLELIWFLFSYLNFFIMMSLNSNLIFVYVNGLPCLTFALHEVWFCPGMRMGITRILRLDRKAERSSVTEQHSH